METGLVVQNVSVSRGGKTIFRNVSFSLLPGEAILLTGPNGAGKSTLALTLMGHPGCVVESGSAALHDEDILALPTFERARHGMFLAHQEPPAIGGVSVADVLRSAREAHEGSAFSYPKFHKDLLSALETLHLDYPFAKKELHAQFSGGEKKKIELLSLLMMKPKIAILDEIDSGMDEAARGSLLEVITELRKTGTAFLIISHHKDVFEKVENIRSLSL
jgi:Fe-S cluster assembly ATP-binding protein